MPPPQCPECGRFLATAFVEQITNEPAPCPGCGTELSLATDEPDDAAAPQDAPPVPPPAATLPAEDAAGADDALDDDAADESGDDGDASDGDASDDDADEDPDDDVGDASVDLDVDLGETTEPASTEVPDGDEDDQEAAPPLTPAAAAVEDVEPEPETSVRPPDRTPDRDPLEGWDRSGSLPTPADDPDPAVLAAGAGAGLVVGLVLGGRDHRGLGALLGAVLGAVLARLRG